MTEPRDRWPDQPDERDAPWTPPAPEHTQPVDVSHSHDPPVLPSLCSRAPPSFLS